MGVALVSGPDLQQAQDSIFGLFAAAWAAYSPAFNDGTAPPIEWPDTPETQTPLSMGDAPWCRVDLQYTSRGSSSIGGAASVSKYTSHGLVVVSIFVPAGKRGLVASAQLGNVALAAFEGQRTDQGVWFSDVVPKKVGGDSGWQQLNVVATFTYYTHR